MILASSSSRSRRTASSSGSSSPKINPWSSGDWFARSSHVDDDLASGLSRLQVADRLGHLAQRERPVDDRRDLPGFDQLFHDDEAVSGVLGAAEGMQLAHERSDHHQLDEATEAPDPAMA